MTTLAAFETKVNQLLTKRNMLPSKKVGLKAFAKHFFAHAWLAHSREGDGFEMLDVLLDDTQLVGGEVFNTNFVLKFEEIYPEKLKNNRAWQYFLKDLIEFTEKEIGNWSKWVGILKKKLRQWDWKTIKKIKGFQPMFMQK
jgi:hypothetical protein